MRMALSLARRGWQSVSPNPMVGAVVVKQGRVVGRGYHRRLGAPHAEVEALRDARGKAKGADVYVTLEPCGHHGKTPPCAEALVDAGVDRVIFAVSDPHPVTKRRGARFLRASGVEVVRGVCSKEARALNEPYFHWVSTARPWVILKWAMTLDGKIATAGGESRWITGESARSHAHGLRRRVDAILIGTETALRDDPLLTARPARGRHPARIVLDRRGRLPWKLKLLSPSTDESGSGRRIYVTTKALADRRGDRLRSRGIEVLVVPSSSAGFRVGTLFTRLGEQGISQVLVEGGASLLGSCLFAGEAHEAAVYVAPRVAGGASARSAVTGPGIRALGDTPWLDEPQVRRLGGDVFLHGRLRKAVREARGRTSG